MQDLWKLFLIYPNSGEHNSLRLAFTAELFNKEDGEIKWKFVFPLLKCFQFVLEEVCRL